MASKHNETARARSRAVWNEMATGWEADRERHRQMAKPVSDWLLDKLDLQPGEDVLDLAAGLGDAGPA